MFNICKTPSSGWINLSEVRKLQYQPPGSKIPSTVVVTWNNGDIETFRGDDAEVILQAWNKTNDHHLPNAQEFSRQLNELTEQVNELYRNTIFV